MNPREGRTFPAYLFGGRLRTSTLALIVAFAAIWWLYEVYEPSFEEAPSQVPASEVVPPGFIPDPAYTWAPRTDFQRQTPTTTTTTPTTTEASTPASSSGPETPPPSVPGEPTSPAPSSPAPSSPAPMSSPPVTTPVPSALPPGPVPPAPPPRT